MGGKRGATGTSSRSARLTPLLSLMNVPYRDTFTLNSSTRPPTPISVNTTLFSKSTHVITTPNCSPNETTNDPPSTRLRPVILSTAKSRKNVFSLFSSSSSNAHFSVLPSHGESNTKGKPIGIVHHADFACVALGFRSSISDMHHSLRQTISSCCRTTTRRFRLQTAFSAAKLARRLASPLPPCCSPSFCLLLLGLLFWLQVGLDLPPATLAASRRATTTSTVSIGRGRTFARRSSRRGGHRCVQ